MNGGDLRDDRDRKRFLETLREMATSFGMPAANPREGWREELSSVKG